MQNNNNDNDVVEPTPMRRADSDSLSVWYLWCWWYLCKLLR